MTKLAVFDLDHTLLDGDSDVLWCDFLMDYGMLDRAAFEPRNLAMATDYKAGSVSPREFSEFYVGTLAGRSAAEWQAWRAEFHLRCVRPRLLAEGRACIEAHRRAGDLLVLSTATNRYITELTAAELGFEHLLATECEVGSDGLFTGRVQGTLNMREGKVVRLREWLAARALDLDQLDSVFYSDSVNDLPLLAAVRQAVAVDPDPKLEAAAAERRWQVVRWRG